MSGSSGSSVAPLLSSDVRNSRLLQHSSKEDIIQPPDKVELRNVPLQIKKGESTIGRTAFLRVKTMFPKNIFNGKESVDKIKHSDTWHRNSIEFIQSLEEKKRKKIAEKAKYLRELNSRRSRLTIRSQSKFRLFWDISTIVWLLYVAVVTPVWIGFDITPSGNILFLERIMDIHFVIDVIINFRTGYYPRGSMREVLNGKLIARNYLKSWFFIDFISSIPFDIFLSGLPDSQWKRAGKLLKVLRVLRLSKLLRIAKLSEIIENMDHNFSVSRNALKMFELLLGSIVLSHFTACIFFSISQHSCNFDEELKVCRVESAFGDVYGKSLKEKYITSLYWAVTTLATIGYGDITPVTMEERAFAVLIMIIGSGFYGYVIASLAQHVSKLDINRQMYNEKMDEISSYMNYRMIPHDLRRRVKQYYKHYLEQKTALKEDEILNQLPTGLRYEVVEHLVHDTVLNVPIFQSQDPGIVALIVTILKPVTFSSGCVLVRQGDVGYDMFILLQGQLDLYRDQKLVRSLMDGGSFGELNVLNMDKSRPYTVIAKNESHCYSLSRNDLMSAFGGHPEALMRMRKITRKSTLTENQKDETPVVHNSFIRTLSRNNSMDDISKSGHIHENGSFSWKQPDHMQSSEYQSITLLRELNEILSRLHGEVLCLVCKTKPRNMLLLDCSHSICCESCAENIIECPLCTLSITSKPRKILFY